LKNVIGTGKKNIGSRIVSINEVQWWETSEGRKNIGQAWNIQGSFQIMTFY
jgi:hypothetical protein